MLITATTTSQNLQEMLTDADLELVKTKSSPSMVRDRYLVFIQNLGAEDIYIDFYKDATSSAGAKVVTVTGEISFALNDLKNANIIAGANSSALRVLINK